MGQAPYLMPGARWGQRMEDAQLLDSMLRDGLHDAFSGQHSGWHTEDLVSRYGITREDQDRWAARLQHRFGAAQAAGKFDDEIVAVELVGRKGTVKRPLLLAMTYPSRPVADGSVLLKQPFRPAHHAVIVSVH